MKPTQQQVQTKIIDTIYDNDFRGIIKSSVRSGKTRILLNAVLKHNTSSSPRILVLYPNVDIKTSWIKEVEIIGFPFEIVYCTFVSMKKVAQESWDYIIFDEAHLIPEEHKLPIAGQLARDNKHVVFASGTYTATTLADIRIHTQMRLIVDYSTDDAIEDNLIIDFNVIVHQYQLDSTKQRRFGKIRKYWSTDVKECERLTKAVETLHGDKKILASLSRMRFINTNGTLVDRIVEWINNNPNERFILFTENEDFGKKINLPMFNSKSKDDTCLKDFQAQKINQLCLIKKGSAGITYPKLNSILISSINSNGETLEQMIGRALLKDTEVANIHVFVSDKKFQLNWLESALCNIKKEKITWIYHGFLL
jgi:superfamily II DNA or RNA helicase